MMPTTVGPAPTDPTDYGIAFMPSHCLECLAAGCSYVESTTVETAVSWRGGSATVTAEYVCPNCGHVWTDRWPAKYLVNEPESPL